jgi:hypothetical protein
MRALLVLGAVVAATTVSGSESMRVDGVLVNGRIHEVSVGDIPAAIADFVSVGSDKRKPAALEVISGSEMQAYEKTHDWGWVAVRRIPRGDAGHRSEFVWQRTTGRSVFQLRVTGNLIRQPRTLSPAVADLVSR